MRPLKSLVLFVFTTCIINSSFGANIDANTIQTTCDSYGIGADTTNTRLSADWTPNTIGITWHSNGNTIGGTATCTYDNSFNLPAPPSRPGFVFNGWQVRVFDISSLDAFTGAPDFWSVDTYDDHGNRYCSRAIDYPNSSIETDFDCGGDETFNDMTGRTFLIRTEENTYIKGRGVCNNDSGTFGETGTPNETDDLNNGYNCWCQLTNYQDSTGWYKVVAPWVYNYLTNVPANCTGGVGGCASACALSFVDSDTYRAAMYGQ